MKMIIRLMLTVITKLKNIIKLNKYLYKVTIKKMVFQTIITKCSYNKVDSKILIYLQNKQKTQKDIIINLQERKEQQEEGKTTVKIH